MIASEDTRGGHEGRAWLTNALLSALGLGLLAMARQFCAEHFRFRIGFSGVSGWSDVLFVAAVAIVLTQPVNRATLWIVLAFGAAFQIVTLRAEPFLSSDIYRYVWDGMVQHAHISPYRYVPGDRRSRSCRRVVRRFTRTSTAKSMRTQSIRRLHRWCTGW